ncbi:MAG TPA: Fe-S protein assembly co-chaperone HscB [Sutterella sp.]|nr:Fe-S protein assembly co-chaperone HscB [Sutterella sp.]
MARESAFSLLGLPARFSLSDEEIEGAWRERIALVHPDRFAAAGDAAKRVAEQWATRLNDAKRELTDPVTRAKALLAINGVDLAEQTDTRMPKDFLMRQFTWRERAQGGQKDAVLAELKGALSQCLTAITEALDEKKDFLRARELTRELLFLDKLAHDLASA